MVQHGGINLGRLNPFKRKDGIYKKQLEQIANEVIEESLTSNYQLNYGDVKELILERLKSQTKNNDTKANEQYYKIKEYVHNRLESISQERTTIDEFMNEVLSQMKEILEAELAQLEKTEINSKAIEEIKAVIDDNDKMSLMILKIVEEYLKKNPIITEKRIYNSSNINTSPIFTNVRQNFTDLNRFIIDKISNIIKQLLIKYKISERTPRLYKLIGQYERIMDARKMKSAEGRERKVKFWGKERGNNSTSEPLKINNNIKTPKQNNKLGNLTYNQQEGHIQDYIRRDLWSEGDNRKKDYKKRAMENWKNIQQAKGYGGPKTYLNKPVDIITNPNDLKAHLNREKLPLTRPKGILKTTSTGGKKRTTKKKKSTKKGKKRTTKKRKKTIRTKKRNMKKGKKTMKRYIK